MKDIDFSNIDLDLNNIGNWPTAIKGFLIAVICTLVFVLGYFLDIQNQLDSLDKVRNKEPSLKKEFETKQAKAANLGAYKEQKKQMEDSFGTMLKQLPSKTEVENLLDEITQTGLASGIEFQMFKPEQERFIEFYAEKPIKVKVTGNYHQFGKFASAVASLPRIVTLHNILIAMNKDKTLAMEVEVKTYRYLDEEEIAQQADDDKKKGKKRRR